MDDLQHGASGIFFRLIKENSMKENWVHFTDFVEKQWEVIIDLIKIKRK